MILKGEMWDQRPFTRRNAERWRELRANGPVYCVLYPGVWQLMLPIFIIVNLWDWMFSKTPDIYTMPVTDVWVSFGTGILAGVYLWFRIEKRYARWVAEHPSDHGTA